MKSSTRLATWFAMGISSLAGATGCAEESTIVRYDARYPTPGAYSNQELQGSTTDGVQTGQPYYQNAQTVVVGADGTQYADTDPSALSDFREPLAPYGAWVDDGTYGTVWVPHTHVVGADFAPYVSAGHWTYDREYVWVSDYSWGWAPFHYGRWVYIAGRGWSWIPGRTYAGAWVTWRTGPVGYGYVGWAPMPPSWYWYNGYAVGLHAPPPAAYVFCGTGDVFSPVVASRTVRGPVVAQIGADTRPYNPGPANDGRIGATPGVNDRVGANPSVGDRVGAAPGVNGRVGATPGANPSGSGVDGSKVALANGFAHPSPKSLGIAESSVVRPPASEGGLARARAFSSPDTAAALGASRPRIEPPSDAVARAPRYTQPGQQPPGMAQAGPRDITPPSTYRSPNSIARAPQVEGVEPRTYRRIEQPPEWTSRPSMAQGPGLSDPSGRAPRAGSSLSAPSFSTPSPAFSRPSLSTPSSDTYSRGTTRPSFAPSGPSFSSPSFSSGGSSFSRPTFTPSTPSFSSRPSTPSFSAPSSGSFSRPTVTPSFSGSTSSGGGGSFRVPSGTATRRR